MEDEPAPSVRKKCQSVYSQCTDPTNESDKLLEMAMNEEMNFRQVPVGIDVLKGPSYRLTSSPAHRDVDRLSLDVEDILEKKFDRTSLRHSVETQNTDPKIQSKSDASSGMEKNLTEDDKIKLQKCLSSRLNIYRGYLGNRQVAVKSEPNRERAQRMIEILRRLQSNKNIVSFITSQEYKVGPMKIFYIIVEFFDSQNLSRFIRNSKSAEITALASSVAKQLAEGLKFIHDNLIIHCNLYPKNVLYSVSQNVIKISGFDQSVKLPEGCNDVSLRYSRIGTDGFRAPELYSDNSISQSADIFSLGLIYHVLWSGGAHPFGEDPDMWNLTSSKIVILHVANGLSFIHEQNVIHRDLKPSNVLVSLDGKYIKIGDFGLSKKIAEDKSKASKSLEEIGTKGWGSPETYKKDAPMSMKSDVFSFGLLSFYVLTRGKLAFGENADEQKENVSTHHKPNLSKLVEDVHVCKHFISRLLDMNPEERPPIMSCIKHPFFWREAKRSCFIIYFKSIPPSYHYLRTWRL